MSIDRSGEKLPKFIKPSQITRRSEGHGISYIEKTPRKVIEEFLDFTIHQSSESDEGKKNRKNFYNLLAEHNPNSEVSLVKFKPADPKLCYPDFAEYFLRYIKDGVEYEFEFGSDGFVSYLKIKDPTSNEFTPYYRSDDTYDPDVSQAFKETAKQMIIHLKKNGVRQDIDR